MHFADGLAGYAYRLRRRDFSIEEATRACLDRILQANDRLRSFVHVAEQSAIQTAAGLDTLLWAGTDLGPLMGVPLGVKDLYTVEGMPTRLGSRVDLSDTIAGEGSFIRRLKSSGCVILGKTTTTEFAAGGINLTHEMPRNPCSESEHLSPGGSSAGSAVAVAAGLCPWAIGSDTGGSVRQPAALCGVVGIKVSQSRWDLDGIFSFSPSFDSLGYFNRTVADAAHVFGGLQGSQLPTVPIENLRFGIPILEDFAKPDAEVATAFEAAIRRLNEAGVVTVPVELPSAEDIDNISRIVAIELIGRLGRKRVEGLRHTIDPVPMARLDAKMDAADYVDLLNLRRRIAAAHDRKSRDAWLDGWLLPTVPHTATPLDQLSTLEDAARWNARTFRITRLANMLNQVALSIPLPVEPGALPIGLQVSTSVHEEPRLLAMAAAVEECLRSSPAPTD